MSNLDTEETIRAPDKPQAEAPSSAASSSTPALAASSAPRSIKLFFGGGQSKVQAQPRSNPFDLNPEASKRRRKNADGPPNPPGQSGGEKQGRIVLNPPGESGWGLETRDEEVDGLAAGSSGIGSGKGRPKGRTKKKGGDGGEEEEMKEMGKRARAQTVKGAKGKGKGKGKGENIVQQLDLKRGKGDDDDYDTEDPIDSLSTKIGQNGTKANPSPKKRGRPAKRKPNPEPGASSRIPSRSTSTTRNSSPPNPIAYVRSSSPHEPNEIIVTGGTQRPKRPIFSRTNTASTTNGLLGHSQNDPIDVESKSHNVPPAKPGPKKLVFASDAKPAHSFFSRKGDTGSTRASSELNAPPSQDLGAQVPTAPLPTFTPSVPAATTDAPLTSQPTAGPSRKVHNFFQANGSAPKSSMLKAGWGNGIKEGSEWLPPWPGAEWPVHEGFIEISTPSGHGLSKRPPPSTQPLDNDSAYWNSVLARAELRAIDMSSGDSRKRTSKNRNHRSDGSDRETLCERFRPRTASQVLGNTTEAIYLRDWLSALSIGTQDGHGPKVIRRVAKKKRKLDDWIVDDIGLFGDPQEEVEEPAEEPIEPPDPNPDVEMGERPTSYPPLSAWLTNTILLTGPNGSGKSAAVYAAASELGWEVFEVYPGIGKRTGGNLMSLVGDVGRNHIVGRQKETEPIAEQKKPVKGLNGFFKPKTSQAELDAEIAQDQDAPSLGSQGEPIPIDDDHEHPEKSLTSPPPSQLQQTSLPSTPFRDDAKFRQSLILIEEVDILFDEEATFWPAIISLIAESRRPVILTCNDIERVMVDSIPLQAILQFQPPTREVAVPYLASLGHQLDLDQSQGYAAGLFERNIVRRPRTIQAPGPPNGNEILPYFDLRRAIMKLQLEMGQPQTIAFKAGPMPMPVLSSKDDFKRMARRADLTSYTDAYLDERSWAIMELEESDRYQPTPDDQLGVQTLLKAELPDRIPTLPAYARTRDIASYLVDHHDHETNHGSDLNRDLLTDQIQYIRTLLPLLDPIIPLSSHLLPHPSLFTDYMPAIQHLVQIDDIRQSAYEAAKAAGEDLRNIKTGRPVRLTAWLNQEYERALDLDQGALDVARQRMRYEE